MALLAAHPDDEALCALAAPVLFIAIAGSEQRQDACVAAGAVPLLVGALQRLKRPAALGEAAGVLGNIANGDGDERARLVVSEGGVAALVGALRGAAAEADEAGAVAEALAKVIPGGGAAAADACVLGGAIAVLAALLQRHAASPSACSAACCLLARLHAAPGVAAAPGLGDALRGAVAAIGAHGGDCEAACDALANFARREGGLVAAAGAIPALVPVLATPSAEPAIAALAHLCHGPTAAHHARAREALAAGAQPLLEALAAAEGPHSAAADLLSVIAGGGGKHLFLRVLPPAELALRMASCLECWLARPCRACPRGGAAGHGDPQECAICRETEAAAEQGPWLALRCGHVFHEQCMMQCACCAVLLYPHFPPLTSSLHFTFTPLHRPPPLHAGAGSETMAARAQARATGTLLSSAAAHCPVDRCVATAQRREGEEGAKEEELEVKTRRRRRARPEAPRKREWLHKNAQKKLILFCFYAAFLEGASGSRMVTPSASLALMPFLPSGS